MITQDFILIGFVVATIIVSIVFSDLGDDPIQSFLWGPVSDGYDRQSGDVMGWEETFVIFKTATIMPIIFWLATWTANALSQMGISGLVDIFGLLRITTYTLIIGGIIWPLYWLWPWIQTLAGQRKPRRFPEVLHASGFMAAVLFGSYLGTRIYVALNPNGEILRLHFEELLVVVTHMIRQFQSILGIQIAEVLQLGGVGVDIFVNNAMLAITGSVLALIGGLAFGSFITIGLVMAMNAALIAGIFDGIIVRNSIVAGSGMVAPFTSPIASFGVLHGFLEFIAIPIAFIGAGFVSLGLVRGRPGSIKSGVLVFLVGIGVVGFAAFTEVFIDPQIVHLLKQTLIIEPNIIPLSLNTQWAVGASSTIVSSTIIGVLVAMGIRETINTLDGLL